MTRLTRVLVALLLAAAGLVVLPAPSNALTSGQMAVLFPSKYLAPPPTIQWEAIGDSRVGNSGGVAFPAGNTVINVTDGYGNGSLGLMFPLSGVIMGLPGNVIIAEDDWNFGVGSQTTAGIRGRLDETGNDNNAFNTTTSPYFTGFKGTATLITSGQTTPFTFTYASGPIATAATGDYISISNGSPACTISQLSYASPTWTATAAPPAGGSAASCFGGSGVNSTIVLSPPAQSSAFASYLGPTPVEASTTDQDNNIGSIPTLTSAGVARYSPKSDPAKVVVILAGTNDGGFTFTPTNPLNLINEAGILDAFGPAQANKIVLVADEEPKGLVTGYDASISAGLNSGVAAALTPGAENTAPERHTVPATGPYTITVDNAVNFFAEPSGSPIPRVWYVPCSTSTSGTPTLRNSAAGDYINCGASGTAAFAAGANDGVMLSRDTSGNCSGAGPHAAGYYCVSSSGVFTFNSGDASANVEIEYRWTQYNLGNTPTFLTTVHNWFNSAACGSYTDPTSGTMYLLPGALCNRPWVHVVKAWEAIVDPNIPNNCQSGNVCYNAPWTKVDGLHDGPYGDALVSWQVLTAAKAAGVLQSTMPFPPPTQNAPQAVGTVHSATGNVAWGTGGMCTTFAQSSQKYWIQSMVPNTNTGIYGSGAIPIPYPVYIAALTLLPPSTHVVCVDTGNNAILMDQAAIGTSGSTNIMFAVDPAALVADGVFDHVNQINTAAIASCGGRCGTPSYGAVSFTQGIPVGYSGGFDAGTTAALANGNIQVNYGMAANPFGDGYDYMAVQVRGYSGTSAGVFTLASSSNATIKALPVQYDTHRAMCNVEIGAGPNTHLSGLENVTITTSDTSTSFTAPGTSTTTITTWGGIQGASGIPFPDAMVQPGAPGVSGGLLSYQAITPPSEVGGTPNGISQIEAVTWLANSSVSFIAFWGACKEQQTHNPA